jgi:DNA-binding NarL/FixJ family response regulator
MKMTTTRILFIGQGLFCEGLTRLLSDFPSVEIIGAVENCGEAYEIVIRDKPDVLIVDHVQAAINTDELNRLLESVDSLKVISLTLSENKMIVHNRQQLGDVTLPVLMKALNISDLGDTIEGDLA